ncbi:MAG: PT domain-containing protein [Oscillospiraceae bacterium]|nr:PT domain-containing protein [Oscillospiraceae bacterium]
MKTLKCALLVVLAMSLLMSGCAANQPEETSAPTAVPTAEPTAEPTVEPTQASTEAPTEPAEPEKFTLKETVLPEVNAATGTLKFYLNGQEVYAGAPVATLMAANVTTYENMEEILQPWHMSSVKRVRIELADVAEADKPFVFFVAMNASSEPKKISECMLYSVTINTDDGISFGCGKEDAPFVTGTTTRDELIAAYGAPDYEKVRDANYGEIAYYEPFSCAYFSFNRGIVRQVTTYYCANVFGDLAANLDYDFENSYFGNDCYILLSQYMDVMPYLSGAEVQTGVLDAVTTKITMGGNEMEMGIRVADMPSPFVEAFIDQTIFVHQERGDKFYTKVGRNVGEQFYFINLNGQKNNLANDLIVKGVFTENRNYANWGQDNTKFLEFQYDSITQDATIEEVLAQYGMPYDIHCTSYARGCFAWLFYKDNAGNELRICVDPILNQLTELRFSKYFEGEKRYD